MRVLHAGDIVLRGAFPARGAGGRRAAGARHAVRAHLPVHGLCVHRRCRARRRNRAAQRAMIMDLGSAFAASVMRQPRQEAFVEGGRRATYADWYREIRSVAGGLQEMGLRAGDHLVVVMRNRYEMATLDWACQLIGSVFTPVSWRATTDEIKYCLEDAEAVVVAFDGASGQAAAEAVSTARIDPRRVIIAADGKGEGRAFGRLREARAVDRKSVV